MSESDTYFVILVLLASPLEKVIVDKWVMRITYPGSEKVYVGASSARLQLLIISKQIDIKIITSNKSEHLTPDQKVSECQKADTYCVMNSVQMSQVRHCLKRFHGCSKILAWKYRKKFTLVKFSYKWQLPFKINKVFYWLMSRQENINHLVSYWHEIFVHSIRQLALLRIKLVPSQEVDFLCMPWWAHACNSCRYVIQFLIWHWNAWLHQRQAASNNKFQLEFILSDHLTIKFNLHSISEYWFYQKGRKQ